MYRRRTNWVEGPSSSEKKKALYAVDYLIELFTEYWKLSCNRG
jgi:hypothetical protein